MPKIKMQTALCPSFEDAFERFIIAKKAKGLSDKSIATYNNHYNAISKYIEPETQMDKLSKANIEYTFICHAVKKCKSRNP